MRARYGRRSMRAISLFSGAGGLDLGCEAAGFQTVAAVELDPTARATMLANRDRFFPDLDPASVHEDITRLDGDELLESAGLRPGEPALVHGGPPCTPFSKSGYWLEYKRAGKDRRAGLLDDYADTVRAARPKAFLMENVYGLAYRGRSRPILENFVSSMSEAGYEVEWRIVLAADLGAPQLRQRLFCVGIRCDLVGRKSEAWRFPWPTLTHGGPHETRKLWDRTLRPHVTVRTALRGLTEALNPPEPEEEVTGRYATALCEIPPGENYLFLTARRGHPAPRFAWRSRYWNFLLKLDPDRPSPTIQGQPGPWVGPFHWENRRLRVGEVKRLMTFPDEYIVLGSRREQQLQLGNAVPPLVGRAVAEAIAAELIRLEAANSGSSLAA